MPLTKSYLSVFVVALVFAACSQVRADAIIGFDFAPTPPFPPASSVPVPGPPGYMEDGYVVEAVAGSPEFLDFGLSFAPHLGAAGFDSGAVSLHRDTFGGFRLEALVVNNTHIAPDPALAVTAYLNGAFVDTVPLPATGGSFVVFFPGLVGTYNEVIIDVANMPAGVIEIDDLLVVPTPAAAPAGLALLGMVAMRRRRRRA